MTMTVQSLRAQDIADVIDIQARCYDAAKLETAQSFVAKLEASPASCFMAWIDDQPVAYLVAMPADAHEPPPLHGESYVVPAGADSLYLHDLSVHPAARGKGVAEALIAAFFEARAALGLHYACLTAVNGSSGFWARHGFRPVAETDALTRRLASYGDGACYMRQASGD